MDDMDVIELLEQATLITIHADLERQLNEAAGADDDQWFTHVVDQVEARGWTCWCHFCWFIATY